MSLPSVPSKTEAKKTHSLTQKQECLKGYATLSSVSLRREIHGAYEVSKSLEAEYIGSLHKQIYLFDLENKYLRKEVDKIGANALKSNKYDEAKLKLQKTNLTSANIHMTDSQRNELINDLVRKCDEIQEKLNREIALRKEQMDIFTKDILKLKGEKEAILKDSQNKDQVIGELKENISTLKGHLVEVGEKFETCRQALTMEIKRRKGLERKIEEERGNFLTSKKATLAVDNQPQKKDASYQPLMNNETTPLSADNGKELCSSICELSKLVTSQTEELKELKKAIYKSEEQRPWNPSFLQIHPKLADDQRWKEAIGPKEDSQSGVSVVRRRWRDLEESKTFEENGVHEDPIQPIEKKTLPLRT